jgi:hypothetical protein
MSLGGMAFFHAEACAWTSSLCARVLIRYDLWPVYLLTFVLEVDAYTQSNFRQPWFIGAHMTFMFGEQNPCLRTFRLVASQPSCVLALSAQDSVS